MNGWLYGTKKVAYCFFKTFAKHVKKMMYKPLKADLCLYFAWVDNAFVKLVPWVDDIVVLGLPHVGQTGRTCLQAWRGTHQIRGKQDHDQSWQHGLRYIQVHAASILVRKLMGEYKPSDKPVSKTPTVAGQVLVKGNGDGTVADAKAKLYWSTTATFMSWCSGRALTFFNSMHRLARHMSMLREAHVEAHMMLIR